jgi:dienelactone hydrolase
MAEGTFDGTIMVANGAVDPFVPDQERVGFRGEMEGADVDYFFVEYGGAVHSFTNPGADDYDIDGVAYDETARRRSFDHMYLLFDHAFRD